VSVERDASWFLDTLYRGQPTPSVIALSWKSERGWRSRYPFTPETALPLVLGGVDVYHRITLLAHKPTTGRGDETASIALPGVWFDADINGSPDGKEGVVEDAFPDLAAAHEIAGAVLEPTMLVCSGYGLQSYYLFDQMLSLGSEAELAHAKQLVQGFLARLRQEAYDRFGVRKLDSVHDLARVFRPVGSFNGKGFEPRPVELIDDGGTRYAVEDIAAQVIEPAAIPPQSATNDGPARSVEELLGEFSELAKIIGRRGKSPGDGSPSAWDFYLCCEAIRYGCDDDELSGLIRHARAVHPDSKDKGARGDYVQRTIEAARARVPRAGPAQTDAERERIGLALSRRWGFGEDDPIVGGRLVGPELDAIVRLRRRSGAELRLGHLRELFKPTTHTMNVSVAARTQFPMLSPKEAAGLAQKVIALCEYDQADERDLADQWTSDFINHAGAITDAVKQGAKMHGETAERWKALKEREKDEAKLSGPDVASRTALIRDEQGRLWIPAGPLRASLSPGAPTWSALDGELADAGWTKERVDQWKPGIPHAERTAKDRARGVFYVEPEVQPPDDDAGEGER
jgi:hypothetical protein